jgi:hypothetical protein
MRDHEETPPLGTGASMIAAIERHFDEVEVASCPYLYRTIAHWLDVSSAPHGDAIAAFVLEAEERGISAGALEAVGLRIVAR